MFKITMEQVVKNSSMIESTLVNLRNDLNFLKSTYNEIRIQILNKENNDLAKQVEDAKRKLIQLEISNGVKQIHIPNTNYSSNKSDFQSAPIHQISDEVLSQSKTNASEIKDNAPKKEKKNPEKKPSKEQAELPVDIGRLDLRVGQIKQVEKHPDADSLYVSKIQCGDPALRTVVSGLVKFVPITELQDRKVVVLCNLKPVKMRGIISEAMVMCASTPEAVEVLIPPAGANPGDLIECEGYKRQPDAQLNPKKKIFETVAPDLKTNDSLEACYKEVALVVSGKGVVTSKSLKNVNIK